MTPESMRVKQWREANKKRYNDRMKQYMKDRRARARKQEQDNAAPAPDKKHASHYITASLHTEAVPIAFLSCYGWGQKTGGAG